MKNKLSKLEKEKQLVAEMIAAYCRRRHHSGPGELCPECRQLVAYAEERADHCPFMDKKTYCSNCPVHCYQPEKRQQIKTVMRFAAPRLLYTHPFKALDYVFKVKVEKRFLQKNRKNI